MTVEQRQNNIKEKLHEFSNYLVLNKSTHDISLISGAAGEVLFLSYYSNFFSDNSFENSIHDRLHYIINEINKGNDYATLAGGICGISWTLEHLVTNDMLDFDIVDFQKSTDEFLFDWLKRFIINHNYDYLHGALGIANYFLNRNTPKTNHYINEFIEELSKMAIINKDSICFESVVRNTGVPFLAYNFSLSHGMTSIIYFLQRCLTNDDLRKNTKIHILLEGINAYYRNNENDISVCKSYFPNWISETNNPKNSRMAWCYGDMGIGITYLNYGINTNRSDYIDYGNKLLNNTLKRKEPIEESIKDAGLCHGSSGLSAVYEKAYTLTNNNEYLKASNYWVEIALKQSIHHDGICGYKAYVGDKVEWVKDTGFLEGISGIGLSFLSHLDLKCSNWKTILMIS